jgi:hypothetical protein
MEWTANMGRMKEIRSMYIIFVQKSYKLNITPRRREAMLHVAVVTSLSGFSLLWSLLFMELGLGLLSIKEEWNAANTFVYLLCIN